jgi:hypothetical protein
MAEMVEMAMVVVTTAGMGMEATAMAAATAVAVTKAGNLLDPSTVLTAGDTCAGLG